MFNKLMLLHGAFGSPWPKGTKAKRLGMLRRHRLAQVRLFNAITNFVNLHPTQPLDWDNFAKDAAVSVTVAQDLYYG